MSGLCSIDDEVYIAREHTANPDIFVESATNADARADETDFNTT